MTAPGFEPAAPGMRARALIYRDASGTKRAAIDALWPVIAELCYCQGYVLSGRGGRYLLFYGAPGDVKAANELQAAALEEIGSWTVKELRRRDVCDGLRAWLRRRRREYFGAANDRFSSLIKRHRDQLWRELKDAFERRDGFDPRLNPAAAIHCTAGENQ